jgi:hypothetical protein
MKHTSNTANAQPDIAYTSRLPSDFNQTLRQSFTKALTAYYPPAEEFPLSLCELLARIKAQDV